MQYAVQSVAAGFIGLDFEVDLGDLTKVQKSALPHGQTDCHDFATVMQPDDKVLIIVHHFPFALAVVSGPYNYIKEPDPKLGVWFRHFRRIDRKATKYFADRVTNANAWERLEMIDTIALLKESSKRSYQLIDSWK